MNIYHRYASREHDKEYFQRSQSTSTGIKLRPLSGQFDVFEGEEARKEWPLVFPQLAFFLGHDAFLGHVVTMVYKNESTLKISAVSVTKFGCNVYENLMIDPRSRFWPACENLEPAHRDLNVRRALAVSNLKNYNKLWNNKGVVPVQLSWDETNAGALASTMEVISGKSPEDLGAKLMLLGLLQTQNISSVTVDVVYDTTAPAEGERTIEDNNRLVYLLGKQMELLFDPLLEYSPQAMDFLYFPENPPLPIVHSQAVERVVRELMEAQTHFTMDLVGLLQDFIVPLRVSVLSSKTTLGILKVNLVFPPTIDEIARINCILHELLARAAKHGYVEVFKVLGGVLPYFYKAFVRHEANLSNFHARLEKFVHHNHAYAFESKEINKGNYSARGIESIVSGSILELPRLKLIIRRLYETIETEKAHAEAEKEVENPEGDNSQAYTEAAVLDLNYKVSMEVIDSFGYREAEKKGKSRIFTPSGKLLTELATEWPEELQYGWMNRKVVGIYEVQNVTPGNKEVLIIFSDHLLFLEVLDSHVSALLLPDILMNSLVNEKPLPRLSLLPKLRVKYWCDINDLLVRSYTGMDGDYLCFTTDGENRFKTKNAMVLLRTQNYKIASAPAEVMDLVSKAKVLHKSSPFHLFKLAEGDLQCYFCAHDKQDYETELSTSLVVMLLNMSADDIDRIFREHPTVFVIFNASYLNDHTVNLSGYNRQKNLDIEEIISVDDFTNSLRDVISKAMDGLFHSSYLSKVLIESGETRLANFGEFAAQEVIPPKVKELKEVEDFSKYPEIPQVQANLHEPKLKERQPTKTLKHKSLLLKFFSKIKGNKTRPQSAKEELQKRNERKISNTDIPRGRKTKYKSLYNPVPQLQESTSVSSTPVQSRSRVSLGPVPISPMHVPSDPTRMVSVNTASSSHYTNTSLDVDSNFRFPRGQGLEDIAEDSPERLTIPPRSKFTSMDTAVYIPRTKSMLDPLTPKSEQGSPHPLKPFHTALQEFEPQEFVPPLTEKSPLDILSTYQIEPVIEPVEHELEPIVPETADIISVTAEPLLKGNASAVLDAPTEDLIPARSPNRPVSTLILQEHEEEIEQEIEREIDSISRVSSIAHIPEVEATKVLPKRRIFSSQDIAAALEHINANGISPETYEKYKAYENFPISMFYNDGESNWVALARDNSSNLHAQVREMKEEANMDTLDVIDVREALHTQGSDERKAPMVMRPQLHQFDSSDGTFSTLDMGIAFLQDEGASQIGFSEASRISFAEASNHFTREASIQSLTSLQYVSEFGRQLDEEWELSNSQNSLAFTLATPLLDDDVKTLAEPERQYQERKECPKPENILNPEVSMTRLSVGTPNMSSSEDEYYSSNEYALQSREVEDKTVSPSSSEKTLLSERTLQNEPLQEEMPGFGVRFDSVAYLSDILNGTVKI